MADSPKNDRKTIGLLGSSIADFSQTEQGLSRNPLGIIALFIVLVYGIAGLVLSTSVSALQPDERRPLVWFLVTFPVVVLGVFSWLVSKHHSKLYAPKDFQSDTAFRQTVSQDAQRQRLEAEVMQLEEAETTAPNPVLPAEAARPQLPPPSQRALPQPAHSPDRPIESASASTLNRESIRARVLLAEDLVLRKLEAEFAQPISRQSALNAGDRTIRFDGTSFKDNRLTAIEVKLLRESTARNGIQTIVRQVRGIVHELHSVVPPDTARFILAVVIEGMTSSTRQWLEEQVDLRFTHSLRGVEARFFDLDELKAEFGVTAT